MLKSFFSRKSIFVCLKSIFSQLSFPDVTVTAGCWLLWGLMQPSRQVVERQAYKQTGQTRRLNRPPPRTASHLTTTFLLTTYNFSSLSIHQFLTPASLTSRILSNRYLLGWLLIFYHSTLLKLNFLLASHNNSLITTYSACNPGFIFDEHLTFSDQISALSKSCYYHIRELCCLLYLDFKLSVPKKPLHC